MQDAKRLLASHASGFRLLRESAEGSCTCFGVPLSKHSTRTSTETGYFWGRALLIRPVESGKGMPLSPSSTGTSPSCWTSLYDGACARTMFFAEDAFGVQFGIRDGRCLVCWSIWFNSASSAAFAAAILTSFICSVTSVIRVARSCSSAIIRLLCSMLFKFPAHQIGVGLFPR